MPLQSALIYSSDISQVDHGVTGPEMASSLWQSVNRGNIYPQEPLLVVSADESSYIHGSGLNMFGPDMLFPQRSTSTSFSSMQSLLSGVPSSINYNMKLLENTAGMRDSHLVDVVQPINGACTRMGNKGSSLFVEDRNTFLREQVVGEMSIEDRYAGDIGCMSATSLANTFNDVVEHSSLDTQPNNTERLKYLTGSGDVPLNGFGRFPVDDFCLDACLFADGNNPILKPHVTSSILPKRLSGVEKAADITPVYATSHSHGMSHTSWRPEMLECFAEKDILSHASTRTVKLEDDDALNLSEKVFGHSHPGLRPDASYHSALQSNTFQMAGGPVSSAKLASQFARCELPARVEGKETQKGLPSSLFDEQSDLWQKERGYLQIDECTGLLEEAKAGELCKTNTNSSTQISEVDLHEREDGHIIEKGCGIAMLHDGDDSVRPDEPVPGQASIVSPEAGKSKKGMPAKNLHAERRRRKKLNERLYLLRSVVPKISKMDRASILGDAIDYLKDLLQQINNLQRELKSPPSIDSASLPRMPVIGMDNDSSSIGARVKEEFSTLVEEREVPSPKVEVNTKEGRVFDIHMVCSTQPGLLLATVKKLDELGLDIQQAVVSCFDGFSLDIFRAEQPLEKDFQPEDIKSALLQTVGCEQAEAAQYS